MIAYYGAPTANCQRVEITLAVLGVPFTKHVVDRAGGETNGEAFRALNPARAVPVIVDSDVLGEPLTLSQSGAILLYLADREKRLIPADLRGRAETLRWLMHALTDVNPASSLVHMGERGLIADAGPGSIAFFRARLDRFLGDADLRLSQADFLAGELSIADLALYPIVVTRWADTAIASRYPSLARWAGRVAAMPAVHAVLPLPG